MFECNGRKIGSGEPVFIIAEAGVNHNGNIEFAKKLITAASESGADAVKFQTWITEKLVAPQAKMAEYQTKNMGGDLDQYTMLKQLELSQAEFAELKNFSDSQGILFLSTPDEADSADFLDQLGVPLFKIGSAEITNLPFLRHIAQKLKPIILSTGMSDLEEVKTAVSTLESAGNREVALLHCVSNYPASPDECNLRAMQTLANTCNYPVGFSDHTLGVSISVAAVALGACIIEKHFTLNKSMVGPDHAASLDPDELKELVTSIRAVEQALGDGIKQPVPAEIETRKVVRKSLVAARYLSSGETIAEEDLALLRTSGGLDASYKEEMIGKRVTGEVQPNQVITLDMIT